MIVSMAWLPQVRAQRLLRDVYAQATNPKTGKRFAFDILVVDEAHHVAPFQPVSRRRTWVRRGHSADRRGAAAGRQVRAPPVPERDPPQRPPPESFTALMEMIDPRRFSRGALLDSRSKDVTVRRLKTDLSGKGFKKRTVSALDFTPSDAEQEKFSLLDDIVTKSAKLNGTKPTGDIVTMLSKRFLSSPFAFGMTLSHYLSSRAGRGLSSDYDDVFGGARRMKKRVCGSRTRQTGCASPRASDPVGCSRAQGSSNHSWSGG